MKKGMEFEIKFVTSNPRVKCGELVGFEEYVVKIEGQEKKVFSGKTVRHYKKKDVIQLSNSEAVVTFCQRIDPEGEVELWRIKLGMEGLRDIFQGVGEQLRTASDKTRESLDILNGE